MCNSATGVGFPLLEKINVCVLLVCLYICSTGDLGYLLCRTFFVLESFFEQLFFM